MKNDQIKEKTREKIVALMQGSITSMSICKKKSANEISRSVLNRNMNNKSL